MKRTVWFLAATAGCIAVLSAGCGGETFAVTEGGGGGGTHSTGGGGQGGSTQSVGGGGQGGAGAAGGVGGSTGGAGGQGGAPVCQPLSDACALCTFGACQDQYCSCYSDQDCVVLVACEQACITDNPGDPDAQQACQQVCAGVPGAKDHISQTFLLGDCAAAACPVDCPGVAELDGCGECLFTSCDSQMNECLASSDCAEILLCVQSNNCGDTTCLQMCSDLHPNNTEWNAVAACLFQNCLGACTG